MEHESSDLIKAYACDVETQEEIPVRFMTQEEIKEREQLNIANTASALRARVKAELAKLNGHAESSIS